MSWSSFYGVIGMTKKDVIQLLEKIAIYMELNGDILDTFSRPKSLIVSEATNDLILSNSKTSNVFCLIQSLYFFNFLLFSTKSLNA